MDDLFYKKIFVFSNVIPYCYIHLWNSLLVQYNEYLISTDVLVLKHQGTSE